MKLEIQIRSTGPGKRRHYVVRTRNADVTRGMKASAAMGKRWMRMDTDYKGRRKWCADGVSIVIRERR